MIKTGNELANTAINVAKIYKTLYVMGAFGAPLTEQNKDRYISSNPYNARPDRENAIKSAMDETFGFDCVGLVKGLLWDWCGDTPSIYGGADYCKYGISDLNANQMIRKCTDVSADFSNILTGEVVWMTDHIGIYIGNGLAVECTPRWKDGVQITAVHNIGQKSGYNGRSWTSHGKLPWISYEQKPEASKTTSELVNEVIQGKWGAGADRKNRLEAAGYDYSVIQQEVNRMLSADDEQDIDRIAHEVILGKWGSGADRVSKLTAAGHDAKAVQKRVNELMEG